MTSLQNWLTRLEQLHPTEIDLGLERISTVASRLNIHALSATVITVAGTNGKGSCVAVIEKILLDTGYRVGAYTSPHFIHFNERFRIAGKPIDDELIVRAFEQIDSARHSISLSYFEYTTLAGLLIFEQSGLDVVLLEVGLGGRLDAVNIVDADIAIVTSIALDHEDYLGDDLGGIGIEKAGIFRSNKPAICGKDCPTSVYDRANDIGAHWFESGRHFQYHENDGTWCGVKKDGEEIQLVNLGCSALPAESVSCALQALILMNIDLNAEQVANSLSVLHLPGRFERAIYQQVPLVLDVAHNPAAAQALASRLALEKVDVTLAVVSMMKDKNIAGVLAPLVPLVKTWFLAQLPENPRAATPGQMAKQLLGFNEKIDFKLSNSVASALKESVKLSLDYFKQGKTVTIVVFGSFFTVAEVMEILSLT